MIIDDPNFDATRNPIAGRLILDEGDPNEWKGDTVVIDDGGRWMLRPGDLVRVNMSAERATDGYFVPMDAISRQGSDSYLFVLEGSGEEAKVKRIPIQLAQTDSKNMATTSGMRRIEPVDGESLNGLQFITSGAHYLIDGEPVRVISSTEAN